MATEILANLLETGVLSEEAGAQINEALDKKLDEAREEITAELREEFAQKFEHYKSVIVEAMDNMLNNSIKTVSKKLILFLHCNLIISHESLFESICPLNISLK